ncbi:MAG TPA: cytochrome P450 [Mycobacteriales bacterium]|nr:cytochrome P450 [Mycobacteriales bacterium]
MSQPESTLTFPVGPERPFDLTDVYIRRLTEDPISPVRLGSGQRAWLVTRYEDVRALLRDSRISADATRPGFPVVTPQVQADPDSLRMLIRMDPPEHGHFRRMLTREFTIGQIEAMRPAIERIVDDCLDAMAGATPPVDLVDALALPVPSRVICDLLGVPYHDHAFFQDRARAILRHDSTVSDVRDAFAELDDYLHRLVAGKEDQPTDDLLGRLISDRESPGDLSRQDLVEMARLLLVAGHETTANMIGLGTLVLLQNPVELDRLRADPSLVAGTVEELLRFCTIVRIGLQRVALADIEIGGQTIRAGDGVIPLLSTANRDPAEFDHPDRLDVGRDAHGHVAFGFGPHQCLGQALARIELQVVFARLVDRFATLRLAVPAESVPLRHDMLVYGTHELPVTW